MIFPKKVLLYPTRVNIQLTPIFTCVIIIFPTVRKVRQLRPALYGGTFSNLTLKLNYAS